ncbi:store-operated calcium entry regulator STIMATE-like [Diadema setosum]|uniref:store-operated calcium entry regulator STIMATE-like n=1 Tax=Diadema setosum TaxID=31175 RepID=UPI003B3BAE7F
MSELGVPDDADNTSNVTEEGGHCTAENFTDGFGMLAQGILAFLAFSFLVLKRLREPKDERRPWKIWFFDTSKQAVGTGLIHVINTLLSIVSLQGDACTWYIIYFLLDSTAGLFFIYVQVRIAQVIVTRSGCKSLRFGEYGDPPQYDAWIGQCGVFIIIVIVEKILITLLTLIPFWTEVAEVLLSPIHNPRAELTLVMLVIPFIVNTIMFWVVDNFLMGKRSKVKGHSKDGGMPKGRDRKQRVHYYRSVPAKSSDGSESEVLLSPDEEDTKPSNGSVVVRDSNVDRPTVKRIGDAYL